MVTQKDIAAACGVSTAAVSRALNDHSDISEETKTLIRRTAEKLGYGKNLSNTPRRAHHRIGLLVTRDAETWFHTCIIMEIRSALMERGYDLVLLSPSKQDKDMDPASGAGNTGEGTVIRPARQPGYLARARILELDGIFFFSSMRNSRLLLMEENTDLRELILGDVPVIPVDCRISACSSVIPAYETGMQSLLKYAFELGHWRVAVVYGNEGEKSLAIERAVRHLANDLKLRIHPQNMRTVKAESAQDAYDATLSILKGSQWIRPTCMLYGDDFLLEGGRAAIRSQGLRIPEDISVAAISIVNERTVWNHSTTSWQLRPSQIAEEAVDMMLEASFKGAPVPGQIHRVAGHMNCGETLADLWGQLPSDRLKGGYSDTPDGMNEKTGYRQKY